MAANKWKKVHSAIWLAIEHVLSIPITQFEVIKNMNLYI